MPAIWQKFLRKLKMSKFIQVTLLKEQGGIGAYINTDHIVTIVSHNKETHISLAHLDTVIKVIESPYDIIKMIERND